MLPPCEGSVGEERPATALVVALLATPVATAPVVAAPGYSLQLSSDVIAIGDTLTITPVVTSPPDGVPIRCQMLIEHGGSGEDWVRMQVASNGCEPWTFTVPDGPIGQFLISGILWAGLAQGSPTSVTLAPQHAVDIGPGTPVAFSTNYPVQSWDLDDLVSTSTPTYGAPLSISPSATAEGCQMRILGGFEQAYVRQASGCQAWTFSIPDWDPHAPASIFLPSADVQVASWTGSSPYLSQTRTSDLLGRASARPIRQPCPRSAPAQHHQPNTRATCRRSSGGRCGMRRG
jgi:hypothetical protein